MQRLLATLVYIFFTNFSEYERSFTVWRAVVGILHLIRSQFYVQLEYKALLSFTLKIKIWVVAYFDPKKSNKRDTYLMQIFSED